MLGFESPIGLIWSRISCFSGDYSLMGMHKYSDSLSMAAMIHYPSKAEAPVKNCLFGLPVNMRLAMAKNFAKDVKYTQVWNLGSQLSLRDKLEMPLNKDLKLTV